MVRADLTLHIITISVLYCLFFPCGAEVDTKNRYDDWNPHFFTERPFWDRFTHSPPPKPKYYYYETSNYATWLIFLVFGVLVIVAVVGVFFYRIGCCKPGTYAASSSTAIVHPSPRRENSQLPSSNQRNSNRIFISPRSSSSSLILSPEEMHHVIVFTTYTNPDSSPETNERDNPPDYATVVTSDLTNSPTIKYPAVKPDTDLDSYLPKYEDYKSHK